MAHQVRWNKDILDVFIEAALLDDFEIEIMRTRINNMTISEQATRMNCSKSKIEKTIANLKIRYDDVQKLYPDKLPQRKFSAKELYMDNH